MAIQPIDLQTLFTQVEKVGKEQMNQREGAHLQSVLQNAQIQKKTDEHFHSVNELQDTGDGAERVKDRGGRRQDHHGRKPGGENSSGPEDGKEPPVIRDPALGKNIDISG
ncbi:MAG: hypothetical protein LBU18_05450 [Treponema sp.]|jgi:hypothetical protein|nr:hypothetical protein [Treponema sp.]